MSTPYRILVVGPSWVGDMVMTQSMLKVLQVRHPGAVIDVLAPGWSRPLLERMPEVADSIEMPVGHGEIRLGERHRLARALAVRGYDQAILVPNSFKSALVPAWARIPRRTGWVGELRYGLLNDIRRLDRHRYPMTVQRLVALALEPGAELPPIPPPALQVEQGAKRETLAALGLEPGDGKVLALCPGAEYGVAKQWPATSYGELAGRWIGQGWQAWLFGSERDRGICAEVNRLAGGRCRDLAGHTTLGQAVDLLSCADAVVSNDSGLMHVAAALDRPLVAIYGSSDPGFTPPLGPRSRIVRLGLGCSPCFKRVCPLGHTDCLKSITVDQVATVLVELIKEDAREQE